MARVVRVLGWGGQRFVESHLGWNRGTIRQGERELQSGVDKPDRFHDRGRRHTTVLFPTILEDLKDIVRPQSQTDPSFKSTRIYTPLTAGEIRRRLWKRPGYNGPDLPELPCERTIRTLLVQAGIHLKRVAKTKPLKKIPETDAIFREVHRVNAEADADPEQLRLSLDCKTGVKIGAFSRGGRSRQERSAWDHDFKPEAKLIPFGILLPETNENFFYFTEGKVTADFMVDCLEKLWTRLLIRCPNMKTLVINADNGPESSGRRRQWLKRLVAFAEDKGVIVELAYYPPYHSKYNPVERCWGVLENHWRGELLDSVQKTLGLARSMTYNGVCPVVELIRKMYRSGVTLSKEAMCEVEARLVRKPGLEKWFITIAPQRIERDLG